MKKFIYSLIASVMFVAPIWYWLTTWWGITLDRPPSIKRFIYIYSNDSTIVTITLVNLVLYLFAMWKIWTMGNGVKVKTVAVNNGKSSGANGNNYVPPVVNIARNGSATDISKWEALYGANAKRNVTTSSAPQQYVQQNNVQTQVGMQPQPQTQQQVQMTTPATNTVQPEDSNVVNLSPVTANDVYRQQIKYMLADGGYEFVGNCPVNGIDVDFMAVAESDTFVVGIINSEYGEIVANDDAEFGDTPSVWYTGEHKYNSPVWEVKNVAIEVKRMIDEVLPNDNGIEVVPVVVVPNATIINTEEVMDSWQELGVQVTRFINKTELPDLLDALPDKAGTDVLDSYRTFALTLMKYFKGKGKGKTRKVAG